jgi:hypothetical protein
VDGSFTLDQANHLRNRIFHWNRNQHM